MSPYVSGKEPSGETEAPEQNFRKLDSATLKQMYKEIPILGPEEFEKKYG